MYIGNFYYSDNYFYYIQDYIYLHQIWHPEQFYYFYELRISLDISYTLTKRVYNMYFDYMYFYINKLII